jgi:cystathionine beta-lyase
VLSLVAMEAAYTRCDDWLAELRAYLTANRDFALEYIRTHMSRVRYSVPDGTYLMWLDFGAYGLEGAASEWMLEHAKVGLNGGVFFGEENPGFVRLNFGCPRSLLADGLDRMAEALNA